MNTALLLAGFILTEPPAGTRETVPLPAADSTQRKVQELDARLNTVQKLTKEFADLTGPDPKNLLSRKKEADGKSEDTTVYLARVEALVKTRARLLILLREEYERTLVARYTLECELAAVDGWIRANEKENKDFQLRYEARQKKLRDRRSELRRDGMVVAALLRDKLQLEHDELVRVNKNVEASALNDTLAVLNEATVDLDKVPGRLEIEKKYEKAKAEELRKALREIRNELWDIGFELPLVEQFAAVETSDYFRELADKQQEAITQARKLLKDAAEIEDRAAEVAILSRYTAILLGELASGAEAPQLSVDFQNELKRQPQLKRSLDVLTGKRPDNDDKGPLEDLVRLLNPDPTPKPPAKKP